MGDFDGDGKDDIVTAITRINGPSNGLTWYWMRSTGSAFEDRGIINQSYGIATDQFYVADIDGDQKDDIVTATARVNGNSTLTWYWMRSTGQVLEDRGIISQSYGVVGDAFYPADFDGDGKDDLLMATARINGNSTLTWYWMRSTGSVIEDRGVISQAYGVVGDAFYPADFDADGRDDLITATPRINGNNTLTWYWMRSTGSVIEDRGVISQAYGVVGDRFYRADVDGDGRDDMVTGTTRVTGTSNGLTWYWMRSTGTTIEDRGVISQSYGIDNDLIFSADFDGDGDGDMVLATTRFHPETSVMTWYWMRNEGTAFVYAGIISQAYGVASDSFFIADFDGDGKDDLLTATPRINGNNTLTWYWMQSTGTAIADRGVISQSYGVVGDAFYVADFDGDGKDDVVTATPRINGNTTLTWYWMQSTGSAIADRGMISQSYGVVGDAFYVADFDGDGKDDLLTAITRVNGLANPLTWYWMQSTGSAIADRGVISAGYGYRDDQFLVGDFNGDTRADLVRASARQNGDTTLQWSVVSANAQYALEPLPSSTWHPRYGKAGDTLLVGNYRAGTSIARAADDIAVLRKIDGAYIWWVLYADYGVRQPLAPTTSSMLTSPTALLTITIPVAAVTQTTNLHYTELGTSLLFSAGTAAAGPLFQLETIDGAGVAGPQLQQPITLSFTYLDDAVSTVVEPTIRLYRWTGNTWIDAASGPYTYDPAHNRVVVSTNDLGQFRFFSQQPYHVAIPVILK